MLEIVSRKSLFQLPGIGDKIKEGMELLLVPAFIQLVVISALLGGFFVLFLLLYQQAGREDLAAEVAFIKSGFIYRFVQLL